MRNPPASASTAAAAVVAAASYAAAAAAVQAMALRSTEVYGSSLVDPLGRLNTETARTIFEEFDKDSSGMHMEGGGSKGLCFGTQLLTPWGGSAQIWHVPSLRSSTKTHQVCVCWCMRSRGGGGDCNL